MIKVYATTDNGDGYTSQIGEYQDVSDIQIRVGMFADDVLITVEEDHTPKEDNG